MCGGVGGMGGGVSGCVCALEGMVMCVRERVVHTQRISSMIGHQFHRRVVSSKKPIRMLAQHHVNMSAIADAFARQELIHQTENHTSCVRNALAEIRARKCVRHGVEPVLNIRNADR